MIIIQGTPCIEITEVTKVNFAINNIKRGNKTKQEQAGNIGENSGHFKMSIYKISLDV